MPVNALSAARVSLTGAQVETPQPRGESTGAPLDLTVRPEPLTTAQRVAEAAAATRSTGHSTEDLLVTSTEFFAAGVAASYARTRLSGTPYSLGEMKRNITNWDNDWGGVRTGAFHNYIVHGLSVGVPAFVMAKNLGLSDGEATAMVGVYATGVEFGQKNAHDAGDVVRSMAMGYLGGKAVMKVTDHALEKYRETGDLGWKLLAGIGHFNAVVGKDSHGSTQFTISYNASF